MTALALADRPAWLYPPRSPARQALADLHNEIQSAEREAAGLWPPVDRAQGALAEAEAAARLCSDALEAIDAEEVGALVATAQTGDRTGGKVAREFARRRAEAAGRSDEASHRAAQTREVLARLISPYQQTQEAVNALRARSGALIAAVVRDLHQAAMQRREEAMSQLFQAELDARALTYALANEGRRLQMLGVDAAPIYRVSGPLAETFLDATAYEPPGAAGVFAAGERLAAFMSRLAQDPDAQP
jgi:hypothetical protein